MSGYSRFLLTGSLVVVFAATLAVGCAAPRKEARTLKSLEDKASSIVIEKDATLDHAREKAMDIYKEFEKKEANKNLRNEAKRRLADLELEQSEDIYLKQIDKQPDKGGNADSIKEEKSRNAIRLYEDLLANSKDGSGNDKIMYQLAKAYENAGEPKKAIKVLDQMADKFPDLPYAGELHFRRGELHFLLSNYKAADASYSKVLDMGEFSLFYEKALYKRGWTLFKMEKHEASLNSFLLLLDKKLVDVTDTTESSQYFGVQGKEKKQALNANANLGDKELIGDIFRVVNLNLSYLDGAQTIKSYFSTRGQRPYEHLIYEQLGGFYLKQERIRDAAETYAAFAKHHPNHPRAPIFMVKVMDAYQKGGFAGPLFEAKKSFVEVYGVNGPYWKNYDESSRERITPFLKSNMEEIARHYHAFAQKTKKSDDYDRVIEWYRAYIRSFPKDPKVSMMNFRLADAMFEDKRYEDAIKEYEIVAYQYRSSEKGAEAAYAALLAYSEREKQLQGKDKETVRKLAIGSAARFGKVYPSDPRAPMVLMKVTEDLFAMKKYDQAAETARQLLEVKPLASLEQRLAAWTIIAHSSLESRDYAQAESSYMVALSLTNQNSTGRDELVNGLAAAVYKQGEQMRKKGDLVGAIAQFARVKELAPESDINTAAMYDIAMGHMAAKDWTSAVSQFEKFRTTYPNHDLAPDASQNIIGAYMELQKFDKAADELLRLSETKDDLNFKRQALVQATGLYEKAGKTDKVVGMHKRYVALYPMPLEPAVEVRQKIADYYATKNQKEDRQYWLREIVKADQQAVNARTERMHFLAAKASIELAQPAYDDYRNVKLVEPLKVNLKKKKQKMQEALTAFKEAADYGVAEVVTAATYQIGELYRDLAKQLLESERPVGLSTDELEQYGMLLEEQAFPFEEKAIEIHETNAKRVTDGIYDQWVRSSFDVLTKLLPVRYAKTERAELFVEAAIP